MRKITVTDRGQRVRRQFWWRDSFGEKEVDVNSELMFRCRGEIGDSEVHSQGADV